MGDIMNILDNIKDFLYGKEYFLAIYEDNVYIYNFSELPTINNTTIIIKLSDKNVNIRGDKLRVVRLLDKEVVINGVFNNIEVTNE